MSEDQVILKHDELFVVCDAAGDIQPTGPNGSGLYFRDMRHLSTFTLVIEGCPLGSLGLGTDAIDHLVVYLANASIVTLAAEGEQALPQTIAVTRRRELSGGELTERVTLTNYNRFPVTLRVVLCAGADFRDLFDIRGLCMQHDAWPRTPIRQGGGFQLRYESVDGARYLTNVRATPAPTEARLSTGAREMSAPGRAVTVVPGHDRLTQAPAAPPTPRLELTHAITLPGGESKTIAYVIEPRVESANGPEAPRELGDAVGGWLAGDWQAGIAEIVTSNEAFNAVLRRSSADLQTLFTPLPDGGSIIAAGIPWFVAPFGRDSLIVARQLLPWHPGVAAATLRYLASVQGDTDDAWRDEEPGKIIHEMRFGEMARRNVVPHARYYGTVDATPLFLWLAANYDARTRDDAVMRELLPRLDRALEWVDRYGDANGDGFVDWTRRSDRGIVNQNWKDSDNSLQRPDGQPIASPIATIEVQGYVHAAKRELAHAYRRLVNEARADALCQQAERLRAAIQETYWQPELGYYAEALAGDGKLATAISSNAGHLLACGVPDDAHAAALTARLLEPDLFSGWGIRSLSATMPHYNPISYHNGSVWPHDNAFVLWGLRAYRQFGALDRLTSAWFDAATRFAFSRLPELFCGFARGKSPHDVPIAYPVASSPQAWAAGTPYVMVETLLGLHIDGAAERVLLDPWLPSWLDQVEIRNLEVGAHRVALRVTGREAQSTVEVLSNPGRVHIGMV